MFRGGFGIYNAPHRYDATAALQTGFTTETQLISSNNNYLAAEYGRSFIDVPQRLTLMGSYNLPFGEGKQFLNSNA